MSRRRGQHRSVAQPGRAPRSGRGGRRFKSCRSDHIFTRIFSTSDWPPTPQPQLQRPLPTSRPSHGPNRVLRLDQADRRRVSVRTGDRTPARREDRTMKIPYGSSQDGDDHRNARDCGEYGVRGHRLRSCSSPALCSVRPARGNITQNGGRHAGVARQSIEHRWWSTECRKRLSPRCISEMGHNPA